MAFIHPYIRICEVCGLRRTISMFRKLASGKLWNRCDICAEVRKGRQLRLQARRQAALVRATPKWVDAEALREIYDAAVRDGLTVDHKVPLRGELVSGLHVPWNLQLMTREENLKKGNQT